jgi:hypothetical protein
MQKDRKLVEEEILIAKEHVIIPDGKHNGEITDVQMNKYANDAGEFSYIDLFVTIMDMEELPVIKTGVNANISDLSKLGMLLTKAGYRFRAGDEISFSKIKDTFLLREITFKTINLQKLVKGQKMEFANIVYETIDFVDTKKGN